MQLPPRYLLGKAGRKLFECFDLERNLWERWRATILARRIIDRRECNSLEGRRKKKKKKKNAENRTQGEATVAFNWANANYPARVARQAVQCKTTLAKSQALLVPVIHASTAEVEHGSDYWRNQARDKTSTWGQKNKTIARKAKALSKTRGIKATSQALVRETKGLATQEGQLSEDTKNNSVLCFWALMFSQRLALS